MIKKIIKHPLLLSLIIILTIALINSQGFLKWPKDAFFKLMEPAQNASYFFESKIGNFFDFFKRFNDLEKQNQGLKEENRQLQGQLSVLKESSWENDFLRKQLEVAPVDSQKLILADVIGQSSTSLGDCLLINQGANQGIVENSAVVVSGNLLIGRVVEVLPSFAKVLLITNPTSLVNVIIQDSRIQGMIKGNGSTELIMDLVIQEQSEIDSQTIITSGLANIFPPGLLVGRILEINSSDAQVFQKAVVKPAADFSKIEKVFVLIN